MEVREIFVRHRDDEINFDDIPEITDFSKGWRNPEIAQRRKNGYTVIVEHKDFDEIIEIKKRRVPKGQGISTLQESI